MFANLDLNITAQEALDITCEEAKKEELEKLHHILEADCVCFWESVQINQEDYNVINVSEELSKAGVPFKEIVQQSYKCDLTWAENTKSWFGEVIEQRDNNIDIVLSSVTNYIRNSAKNKHRNCVWVPNANQKDGYNWKWLVDLLKKKGFSACVTPEGDIRIDW